MTTQALHPTDPLCRTIAEAGFKRRLWASLARLLQGVWLWWLAALGVLLVDAWTPMPSSLRLTAGVGLAAAVVALLWHALPRREDPIRAPLHDARRIEMHHRLSANELISGLTLAPLSDGGDDFVQQLAERTVLRGRLALDDVDGEVIVDRGAAGRQALGVAAVAVAWIAVAMLLPHLILGGAARVLSPTGDTPPFSFTRIEASADPEAVATGRDGDVTITAEVSGDLPESAELVELDADGEEVRRWPMRQIGASTFTFTLQSLREAMLVRVEAGDGQSRPLRIQPGAAASAATAMADVDLSPTDAATDPGDRGSGESDIAGSPGHSGTTDAATPGVTSRGGTQAGHDPAGDARTGVYRETADTIPGDRDLPDAVMQQAPAQYRPLIRRYFDRLAEDRQQEPTP